MGKKEKQVGPNRAYFNSITSPKCCLGPFSTKIGPPRRSSSHRLGFSLPHRSQIQAFARHSTPTDGKGSIKLTMKCSKYAELRKKEKFMEVANNETDLEINYNSEASTGDKRKREGKSRSKVWEHFTKLIKEDGRSDKCQCNHCQKIFSCSSRSGTTHLLRHIADGICPVLNKEKGRTLPISSYLRGGKEQKTSHLHWKFDQGLGQSSIPQCLAVEIEPLAGRLFGPEYQSLKTVEDDYDGQEPLTSQVKLPLPSALKSHPEGEAWMKELRRCVTKLVELMNGRIPVGSLQALAVATPDYSISTALKCLNEMEDIPQSSEMYLDAIEILQNSEERECFVCLPPEPRRRWLQRMLHHRHPLRYNSNI